MVDHIVCKPIKKFGHFEVWNDGMFRIRSPALGEDEDDNLVVLFPCDIDNMKAALKFKDDVFSEDRE